MTKLGGQNICAARGDRSSPESLGTVRIDRKDGNFRRLEGEGEGGVAPEMCATVRLALDVKCVFIVERY